MHCQWHLTTDSAGFMLRSVAESVRLQITLETDAITVEEFAGAVADVGAILNALDREASGGKRTSVYRITKLTYQSPPVIDVVAEPLNGHLGTLEALRSWGSGLDGLKSTEIAPQFNDDVLANLKRLAERRFPVRIVAPDDDVEIIVSPPVAKAIDRALQVGYSLGGVEGQLATISIAKAPVFSIIDAVTGSLVRCALPSGQEWQRRALGFFGSKVIVTGEVRRDAHGRPISMRNVAALSPAATHDRAVPDPSLVGSFGSLGMETKEYLREVRGE